MYNNKHYIGKSCFDVFSIYWFIPILEDFFSGARSVIRLPEEYGQMDNMTS